MWDTRWSKSPESALLLGQHSHGRGVLHGARGHRYRSGTPSDGRGLGTGLSSPVCHQVATPVWRGQFEAEGPLLPWAGELLSSTATKPPPLAGLTLILAIWSVEGLSRASEAPPFDSRTITISFPTMVKIIRRAPKACHACRKKKIRCDVFNCGIPCANCSSADVECSVSYARKRKQGSQPNPRNNAAPNIRVFDVHMNESISVDGNLLPQAQHQADKHTPCPSGGGSSVQQVPSEPTMTVVDTFDGHPQDIQSLKESETAQSPRDEAQHDDLLPIYIKPLETSFDQEGMRFLRHKKALSLPSKALQDQLIRSYILYVHPFLPLLDLGDFLQAIDDNSESNQISLILFQAVMFAASAFVDLHLLEADGFRSREDARQEFFEKAKASGSFWKKVAAFSRCRLTSGCCRHYSTLTWSPTP